MGNADTVKFVDLEIPNTATTYAAGDNVGGLVTVPTMSHVRGGGILLNAQLIDREDLKAALDIHIYHQKPTVFVDDEANAPDADDLKFEIKTITVPANQYVSQNSRAKADLYDENLPFKAVDGNLYVNVTNPAEAIYAGAGVLTLRLYYLGM